MKKVLSLLVLFIGIIFLTGCINQKAITSDEFIKIVKENKFSVTDVTNNVADELAVNKVIIATSGTGDYQIEYYDFKTEEAAKKAFEYNKKMFDTLKSNIVKKKLEVNMGNYTKYSLVSNGKYMLTTRVKNTLVMINTDQKYEPIASKVIKALGY